MEFSELIFKFIWKRKFMRIAKLFFFFRYNREEPDLPDIKTYSRALVIKTL